MTKIKYTPLEKEFLKDKKRIEKIINKEYNAFNKKYCPVGMAWAALIPSKPSVKAPFRWELGVHGSVTNMMNNFPNIKY